MKVVFIKKAKQELEDSVCLYELEFTGLGRRFKEEVRKAVLRIKDYPFAWSVERGDVRKCVLHKFPFKLLYAVEDEYLLVIALAHQHRKPDYGIEIS
ncbi:MAG: type II toxin-antitoxin system RelE/ParE family toxin [Proteobacteria bacterium]|nr:type II toxin-antitoxin system RelE/ParE family toxin [Pseudomonadota bacterium]MBU1686251.1 type II toxin-antitoxin system RelE/ParE family toxin [Pseudomonadota bacterium]